VVAKIMKETAVIDTHSVSDILAVEDTHKSLVETELAHLKDKQSERYVQALQNLGNLGVTPVAA
jgi:hypothetical protein